MPEFAADGELESTARLLAACCYSQDALAALVARMAAALHELSQEEHHHAMSKIVSKMAHTASVSDGFATADAAASGESRRQMQALNAVEVAAQRETELAARRSTQSIYDTIANYTMPPAVAPAISWPPHLLVPVVVHILLYKCVRASDWAR